MPVIGISLLTSWDIYTDHQGTDNQCALMICVAPAAPPVSVHKCQLSVRIHATCQCPSVPHFSAHQCHINATSVPIGAAFQCHLSVPVSATYQCCQSVPPISTSQCRLSVCISAAYQCLSLLPI
ncbi:unnamed protein product, partial [Staurois parvus]